MKLLILSGHCHLRCQFYIYLQIGIYSDLAMLCYCTKFTISERCQPYVLLLFPFIYAITKCLSAIWLSDSLQSYQDKVLGFSKS